MARADVIADEEVVGVDATSEDRSACGHGMAVVAVQAVVSRRGARAGSVNERLYRDIVEAAQEGVVVIGVDEKVRFANVYAEELLGYRVGEMVGLAAAALVAAEDRAVQADMPERRRRGVKERKELRLLRKDGSSLWTSVRSSPLFDDAGGYSGGLVLFADITARKQAEAALQESEARFRGHFEHAAVGIVLTGLDSTLLEVNPAFCAMLGSEPGGLVGRTVAEITHPDDRARSEADIEELLAGEVVSKEVEKRYLRSDGGVVHARTSFSVVRGLDGSARYLAAVCQDVSAEVAAQDSLRRSEKVLRLLAENAGDLIFAYRLGPEDPGFEYVSSALGRIYGYSPADFPPGSDPLHFLLSDADADAVLDAARRGHGIVVAPVRHRDGGYIWSEARVNLVRDVDGRAIAMEGIVRDISERKAMEEQLVHLALHDPLTGLANRTLLVDRIAQALARLERQSELVALLFIDLDQFKLVNDALGHGAGDELLAEVAARLGVAARSHDTVARLGGDEFVILCEGLADEDEATSIARRVTAQLADGFQVDGSTLFVSASIGVATSPVDGPEDLLRNADAAMYRAKQLGRSRIELFTATLHRAASRHLQLASELHGAVERGELRLHYQPVVRAGLGEVTAFEALLRWEHPVAGLLPPAEFITVADDTGLIVEIGAWALGEACRQAAHWQFERRGLSICVNVSPRQLTAQFLTQVTDALADSGLPGASLVLEITERAVTSPAGAAILRRIRELGVRISVDDFGTGYSSLASLQDLPVDALEVDRSFVQRLDTPQTGAIVKSITDLAHAMGIQTVAEGVETLGQARAVWAAGCDMAQGYLWSRPVDPAAVPELLRAMAGYPRASTAPAS